MLTDIAVRKAVSREKPYKLFDSGGLHVVVTPAGGKLWRMRYSYAGKEKLLSFGPYPALSLAEARAQRDDAKDILRQGKDPSALKRLRKAGAITGENTFEALAREWHALNASHWVKRHSNDVIESLQKEVFPVLGRSLVDDITPVDVIALLRTIEGRGAVETARRVRQRMSAIFVYAISVGRGKADPAAVVQKAMAPIKKGRQPAITDLAKAREMLLAAEDTPARPVTKLAMRILALTVVRPGTLSATPWTEWRDLGQGLWQVPAERMKLRLQHKDDEARDHFVPLAAQTIEAIEALWQITGRGPLAFPNERHAHKPMSENALGYYLNRAGYHGKHVPHGWRSTFSSVMNELYPADRHVIDLMLAHVPQNKVEAAYNRAEHLARRRELAQAWADLILESAPPAAELIEGRRR